MGRIKVSIEELIESQEVLMYRLKKFNDSKDEFNLNIDARNELIDEISSEINTDLTSEGITLELFQDNEDRIRQIHQLSVANADDTLEHQLEINAICRDLFIINDLVDQVKSGELEAVDKFTWFQKLKQRLFNR